MEETYNKFIYPFPTSSYSSDDIFEYGKLIYIPKTRSEASEDHKESSIPALLIEWTLH